MNKAETPAGARRVFFRTLRALLVALSACASLHAGGLIVEDIFGRDLNQHGLTMVDWDGYMANPAIEFFILPPADARFPARATVSADNERLYFDFPSTFGPQGPATHIVFPNASTKVPVYIGNAPDRDSADGHFHLRIAFTGADGRTESLAVPIHEIDLDRHRPPEFHLIVDFSQDRTGMFASEQARQVVRDAVADWAYFLGDMHLDEVPAGAEQTFIWGTQGFDSGDTVRNQSPYSGFLLYVYGTHGPRLRSGGDVGFAGGLESSGGVALELKRSGGVAVETAGNYNTLGWDLDHSDGSWWVSGNQQGEQNELFSIMHHETGHALAFDTEQPRWAKFRAGGCVNDPAVIAYHGSCPKITPDDHMTGERDNESLKGAFGDEYSGAVPIRRWFITKLDLLAAQAVGYKLRPTAAFAPLTIASGQLSDAATGVAYSETLMAQGGIPFYNWTISAGALPDGLTLDSFTGRISGVPTREGAFSFTILLQDYHLGSKGATKKLAINVGNSLK